jgi:nucleoside-diphosphate-sugar epimerase
VAEVLSTLVHEMCHLQPIREEHLLSGPLELANDAYALAKITGVRLARAYREQHGRRWIAAMPTNLYGPFDNFDLETSHVLPALIRRLDEAARAGAASIAIWGTGTPRKLLDTSHLAATGWRPRIDLEDGIARTHAWFREHGMCSDQKARS